MMIYLLEHSKRVSKDCNAGRTWRHRPIRGSNISSSQRVMAQSRLFSWLNHWHYCSTRTHNPPSYWMTGVMILSCWEIFQWSLKWGEGIIPIHRYAKNGLFPLKIYIDTCTQTYTNIHAYHSAYLYCVIACVCVTFAGCW